MPMNDSSDSLDAVRAVERVLIRYAELCDYRLWQNFDEVFASDVIANYGGEIELKSADGIRDMVQSALENCGVTQHLLGNFRIDVNESSAQSSCYLRAMHFGAGDRSDLTYEVWGEYQDVLVLTKAGWRITQRKLLVYHELGTRDVLWAPA